MSDDLGQALADTEPVTVGALRQVLSEALAPINRRMDRLETRLDVIAAGLAVAQDRSSAVERRLDTVEDSLRTIRTTMADMRSSQDGMAADIRALHRRTSVAAE